MNGVDIFIDELEEPGTREAIIAINDLILESHPAFYSKIRFKIPFYYLHSWVCYLNPLKSGGVEWCFIHGQKLNDPQGILSAKNRKMIAGVEILRASEISNESILSILYSAIDFDIQHHQRIRK